MPRGPRLDAPGTLHHVMVRGIERQSIFRDDSDRADFLARLAKLIHAGYLTVYAWALLPNHAHVLVRTGTRPLPRSMRSLLTGYAGAFNRRHHRAGHLFQNRYKSIVIEEEPYLLELVRYLHLNPLRAGFVTDLQELDRFPWTGHATLLGRKPRPWQATAEILGQFARDQGRAQIAYRKFVAAGIPQGRRHDLQGGGLVRSLGGWQAIRCLRRNREPTATDARVLGTGEFVEEVLRESVHQQARQDRIQRRQLDLETLTRQVSKSLGVPATSVSGRGQMRGVTRARHIVAHIWVEYLGRPASELARAWGQSRSNVTWAAKRGAEAVREWQDRIEEWCQ
jgi:putative transposase